MILRILRKMFGLEPPGDIPEDTQPPKEKLAQLRSARKAHAQATERALRRELLRREVNSIVARVKEV